MLPAARVTGGLPSGSVQARVRELDPDSQEWIRTLRGSGRAHAEACARLHELLLRAALFEVARRRRTLPGRDLDDLATEAADDALVKVLEKLDEFRGLSRFTTWAYKFALYEAAVKTRLRAWQEREIPVEPDALPASNTRPVTDEVEQRELLARVRTAIDETLTPHQRDVLVALTLNGVPIDVLAERLSTTRGALYKTLHDARAKLRVRLEETQWPTS